MAFHIVPDNEGTQFPLTRLLKEKAYQRLSVTPFDTLITYAEWIELLTLDPRTDRRARGAILWAGRKVLDEQSKKVINERLTGYRICRPNEHAAQGERERKRARRWLRVSLQTVTHVALESLTPTEVAKVMTEQSRAALTLAFATRVGKMKELPAREQMALPSSQKLVDMMTRKRA
jgi:hypothetical protein